MAYDSSRLALVGRSADAVARQPGVPAELAIDEPSEGTIEVGFRATKGTAATGAGSMAVFEFEAIRRGASAIVVRNVQSKDGGGDTSAAALVTNDRVTIH
jgi:hypothetical protein